MKVGNTDHWQEDALRHVVEDGSYIFTATLAAVLQIPWRMAFDPCFDDVGAVDKTGRVVTKRYANGQWFNVILGTFDNFNGQFQRLADRMKLTETQANELLLARRQWIVRDERVETLSLESKL
jgi:hypothetical protein